MNKQDYQQYLQSRHWKIISDETKRLADYRCQVCYSSENLHAHHRTYERVGDELQSDLICLCGSCHALFHGKVDEPRERDLTDDFLYNDNPIPFLVVAPEPEIFTREPVRIIISIRPSGDEERDKRREKNLFGMLGTPNGKDTFAFKVYESNGDNFRIVEFPEAHAQINEHVLARVSKLIGSPDYEIIAMPEGVLP